MLCKQWKSLQYVKGREIIWPTHLSIHPSIAPSIHHCISVSVWIWHMGKRTSSEFIFSFCYVFTEQCLANHPAFPSASSWEMGIIRSSSYPFHQDYHAITQCWSKQGRLKWLLRPSWKRLLCVPTVTLITLNIPLSLSVSTFCKSTGLYAYSCPYQGVRTASLSPAKSVYRCCYFFRCYNCFLSWFPLNLQGDPSAIMREQIGMGVTDWR